MPAKASRLTQTGRITPADAAGNPTVVGSALTIVFLRFQVRQGREGIAFRRDAGGIDRFSDPAGWQLRTFCLGIGIEIKAKLLCHHLAEIDLTAGYRLRRVVLIVFDRELRIGGSDVLGKKDFKIKFV